MALLLAAGTGLPAGAQYAFEDDAPLPPRAVMFRLQERGFSEMTRPRFDGRAYVLEASGPRGGRVRLVVDARDGAILQRERLDLPYYPGTRPRPGFGWTEDEPVPQPRRAERLVPPADIPYPGGAQVRPPYPGEALPRRRAAPWPAEAYARDGGPDTSPFGVNPSRGREAPRKVARVPAKPMEAKPGDARPGEDKAAIREAPDAPSPKLRSTDGVKDAAKEPVPVAKAEPPPVPKASEPPKPAEAPKVEKPAEAKGPANSPASAPDTSKPAEASKPADLTKAAAAPESTKAALTKPKGAWQDPPADTKRPVRVIGGATVVPGPTEKDAPPAQ